MSLVIEPELSRLRVFLQMIRIEHTLFILPFAFAGAVLSRSGAITFRQVVWIILAMVGARTAAMAFNRLVDQDYDAKNPRTMNRALPKGLLSRPRVWGYFLVAVALYLLSAFELNWLCFILSPFALFFLLFYSYTKRFTWLSHLFLGFAEALAPAGAWLAVAGMIERPVIWLAFGVMFWVAGFDVLYATQDIDFDRREGLHSIPQRFGLKASFIWARAFHLATLFFFALVGVELSLGWVYWAGLVASAGLLAYEHAIVSPSDLRRLNTAFFTVNGIVSVAFFGFTLAAVLL